MIVCRIEIWPHGNRETAREIGRVVVANDGTGTMETGRYKAALTHTGVHAGKPGAYAMAEGVEHQRRRSVYVLLSKVLLAAVGRGGASKELVEYADRMVAATEGGK